MIIARLISNPQFNVWNISYITSQPSYREQILIKSINRHRDIRILTKFWLPTAAISTSIRQSTASSKSCNSSFLSLGNLVCLSCEVIGDYKIKFIFPSFPEIRISSVIREFKRLRRQMQRKRNIKIEVCIKCFAIISCCSRRTKQARCTFACLPRMVWCKGKERNLLLRTRLVIRTSNVKISRRRLADFVKTLHQKACRRCSTIIFLHSTNQIIDLWSCRSRYRRQMLTSLLKSTTTFN